MPEQEQQNTSPSETQRAPDATLQRSTPNEDAASQRDTAGDVQDPDKKRLHEEAASHRKRAKDLEAQLKTYQDAEKAKQEADLSEVERTKKQFSDLQAQHNEYVLKTQGALVQYEVEKQAIALHIVDPEAAAILVQRMGLETDETGKPTNAKKLLEELIKNRPWLVKQDSAQDPASPAQTASQQQAPAVPPFNVSGRSSIAPPNQLPQGTPVRLNQITWKK